MNSNLNKTDFIKKDKPTPSSQRLYEIDGIRGWAALCVLVFHMSKGAFGEVFSELESPFLYFLLDGHLAVYVFFLLSGDALSSTFTSKNGVGLSASMVVKRYFRLAGPILFSCFVSYFLMISNLTYHKTAGLLVKSPNWLADFLIFEPSFWDMLFYSLFDIFVNHQPESSYNNFLWPMGIELVGSLLVFAVGAIFTKFKNPKKVMLVCSLFLAVGGTFYALFFIGILFGILRDEGFFEKIQNIKFNFLFTLVSLAFVAFLDPFFDKIDFKNPQTSIALASTIVFTCYSSPTLISLMRTRLSRFLGELSFPLYYMHFSILLSFTSWLILKTDSQYHGNKLIYLLIIFLSVIVSFGVAYVVSKIENQYLKAINKMTNSVLK